MQLCWKTFSLSGILFFFSIITGQDVSAEDVRYLKRSPKALFMGDAFTSIADDDFTLFYNPAGLGEHRGFSASFINPSVEVTNLLDQQDRFDDFPTNDPVAISDRVMGLPFHLQFGATPTLKMDSVGISLLADLNTNMELYNKTHPFLNVNYKYDRGFVAGVAYSMGSAKPHFQKRNRPLARSWIWSHGLGVKHINREGLDKDFSLFSTSLLSTISAGVEDYHTLRKSLGYSIGSSWGVDYGTIFRFTFNELSTFSFGASVLDIGNTSFNRSEGNVPIPTQEMMVNFGTSFKQDFGPVAYTISADIHPAFQNIDFVRKTHLGVLLDLPLFNVMAGFNGGYLTYGLGLHLGILKLYGGVYGVERGVDKGDKEEKRAVFYLSILDLSFDV